MNMNLKDKDEEEGKRSDIQGRKWKRRNGKGKVEEGMEGVRTERREREHK